MHIISNVHETLKTHDYILATQIISSFSKGRNDIDHILGSKCTILVFNKKTKNVKKMSKKKKKWREADTPKYLDALRATC